MKNSVIVLTAITLSTLSFNAVAAVVPGHIVSSYQSTLQQTFIDNQYQFMCRPGSDATLIDVSSDADRQEFKSEGVRICRPTKFGVACSCIKSLND